MRLFACLAACVFLWAAPAVANNNAVPSDPPAVPLVALQAPMPPPPPEHSRWPALRDSIERAARSDIALDHPQLTPITGPPLRCRKSVGLLVGAIVGGIAGSIIGAQTWEPNWVFTRKDEAMIFGAIGAGVGAFAGYYVCGG